MSFLPPVLRENCEDCEDKENVTSPSLLQHHFKTGLELGKREGRGWKWPGSTGFPFSEFPDKAQSGGQFPNLEPAQRPWAAQLILCLSSLLSQEQISPNTAQGQGREHSLAGGQ